MSRASHQEGKSILHWFLAALSLTGAILLSLMVLSADSQAQRLPDEPTPVKRNLGAYLHSNEVKVEIGADFTVRGLDAYSTHEFHVNPCNCIHENQLPLAVAYNQPLMYGYSFAVATGVQFGAYELWKHGHPKLSRIVRIADSVTDGHAVAGNFHNIRRYGK